ncbi:hypothetical protein DYQ86_03365 [Acidobacteria bacterium AB60]|nr:hypothetical protein DYQ86_03365 [Acidobacteria bacterium AB60]
MTTWEVIRWWEVRRIAYNAVLFAIGITSIMTMEWLMGKVIPVGEDAVEPFALALGVIVYAIMADLCYTLGWIIELAAKPRKPDEQRTRAKRLFIAGLWFSCLLTSLPFWFGLVFWLLHRNHHT